MLPVVEQLADLWPDPAVLWEFEDTKGPAFFVPAAILFNAGIGLEGLRLINLLVAICSAGLVGMLVTTRWHSAVLGGVLLTLLPYHTVLSHLFMSEPSFVLGSIILGLLATTGPKGEPGVWRPLAFGLVLTILLHHRAHAVVPAAAAVLVALQRDGSPAWRYGLAGFVAGLLRLPLYVEWGGLVSPEYANRYGLGFSPEAVVYLLGALAPMVWVGVPLDGSKNPSCWPSWESLRLPLLWWLALTCRVPMVGSDPTAHPPFVSKGFLPPQSSSCLSACNHSHSRLPWRWARWGSLGSTCNCPNQDATKTMASQGTDGICSLLDACCTSQRGARCMTVICCASPAASPSCWCVMHPAGPSPGKGASGCC